MKIDSYAVNMASSSTSMKSVSVTEKAAFQVTTLAPAFNNAAILTLTPEGQAQAQGQTQGQEQAQGQNNNGALLMLTPEGQRQQSASQIGLRTRETGNWPEGIVVDKYELQLRLLESLVGAVTGKKFHITRFDHSAWSGENRSQIQGIPTYQPGNLLQAMPMRRIEFSFQRTEAYHESQSLSFQATGVVNTSDGRQINFDLNILSSYEFSSVTQSDVQARLMDPLVINFDGALPGFTKDRYAFDLTMDGSLESIFMPTNGSGFLALDKDENGKIDDGSELFGAKTGDGFGELAAYDSDGNGWIDEGDDIYNKLKIMFVDKDTGEFMLMSLKEADVGAIYLGSTASDYEIKGDGNETIGVARRHGVFLSESSGRAGSVHHIDLTY